MSEIKLTSPRYSVVLGDPDDPSSWQQLDNVQCLAVDLMRAEQIMQRARQKPTELPIRFGAIGCWSALTRRGDVTGTFADFEAQLIDLDSNGEETATPTLPAPEAG